MRKYYIGIDPGAKGAITELNEDGEVIETMYMPETPHDIYAALSELKDNTDGEITVFLEDVGHGLPSQSSSATAKFARHNGHLEMALIALQLRTITVTPQKWQKTYQLGKSSVLTKTEWKNRLKAKAKYLFPKEKITLVNADSFLIAEYGRHIDKT